MLDLPGTPDAAFQLGKPGKEKSVRPINRLGEAEWQLLMLLGWHMRDFQIRLNADAGVRLLGVASRTIIWSLVKQMRVRLIPLFHGLHGRTALER